jgi:hypothetical protein
MLALSLLACVSTPPSGSTGDPVPLVPSGPTTSSTPPTSSPPIMLPCTSVTGTRGVWLFSRQDPSLAVMPTDPPDGDDLAYALVGPDVLGRLYLLDGNHVLRRSDDQGCSWQQTTVLPEDYTLLTSPSTGRLYAYDGPELYVSDDGGQSFDLQSSAVPGLPIGVQGGTPDELRAHSSEELFRSSDGGTSWTSVTLFPESTGEAFADPDNLDQVVFGGRNGLWLYDGATWTEEVLSVGAYGDLEGGNPQWKDQSLVAQVFLPDDCLLLRKQSALDPFTEIDWGYDIDDSPDWLSMDGEQIVVAGHHDPGSNSEATGPTTGLVVIIDDSGVHRHLPADMSDARGIAFTEDFIVVALAPQGGWEN